MRAENTSTRANNTSNFINQNSDILFALAMVGIIVMFIIPLPPALIDIF